MNIKILFNNKFSFKNYIFLAADRNKQSNLMEIDQEPNLRETGERPNLTFTNTMGQNQLFPSLLMSEPNPSQNIYQNSLINQDKNNDSIKKTSNENINNQPNGNLRKYSEQKVLKSCYVYSALKVIFFDNFN